jgi:hypothetical protein
MGRLHYAVFDDSNPFGKFLIMEVVRTSETSVHFNVTTRRYFPEDSKLHTSRRENQKSHMILFLFEGDRYSGLWGENADRHVLQETRYQVSRYKPVESVHLNLECVVNTREWIPNYAWRRRISAQCLPQNLINCRETGGCRNMSASKKKVYCTFSAVWAEIKELQRLGEDVNWE